MTEIVRAAALALIELLSMLLFVRAILSWFPEANGGKLFEILEFLTEPILAPFRLLIDKFGIGLNIPIDLSFLATILTLQLLSALL